MNGLIRLISVLLVAALSACSSFPSGRLAGDGRQSVAIVPFAYDGPGPVPLALSDIIESDLDRCGRFHIVSRKQYRLIAQDDADEVDFQHWHQFGLDRLVVGSVRYLTDGNYQIQFRLYDVGSGNQLTAYRYLYGPDRLRDVAHTISDIVYESLSGDPGVFRTRLAYVAKARSRQRSAFFIRLSDPDGHNIHTVAKSDAPFRNLSWSADGMRLAYESLERGRPQVYLQNITTGTRELIADHPGTNAAPTFSPDGKQIALTSSRDGAPGIYTFDLATRNLRRLASGFSTDAGLAWSRDGQFIFVTPPRSEAQPIFRLDTRDGSVTLVSGPGSYDTRVAVAPNGRTLAIVVGDQSGQQLSIMDLETGGTRPVTSARAIRSPTFAPNGQMIAYTTEADGRGVLATASADGRSTHVLRTEGDDVREVAWSTYPYRDR